jgi:hypothetical protein
LSLYNLPISFRVLRAYLPPDNSIILWGLLLMITRPGKLKNAI